MIKKIRSDGFTLLEVLIALFIFSVLGVMLGAGLRTVINLQGDTETKAERLRNLQMSLLVMSRDIEQAVQRPIINASGKEEAAFIGTPTRFVFTHVGYDVQRTGYEFTETGLSRMTWRVLDQAPKTKPLTRVLIDNVTEARFEYLDMKGRFHKNWPTENLEKAPLPRGVNIHLTIKNWGRMTQFYLIPVETSQ